MFKVNNKDTRKTPVGDSYLSRKVIVSKSILLFGSEGSNTRNC